VSVGGIQKFAIERDRLDPSVGASLIDKLEKEGF
jgi:hypothetical protein